MDHRPIGIFDSGLGGLTALMALRRLLPEENIVYFGDTARMPYGTKTVSELRTMAQQNMELLDRCGAKAILAACGTVSCTAPDVLAAFHLPVFNVLDAAVETAAKLEGDKPLGIIATQTSIQSGVFENRIARLCPKRTMVSVACQDFVKLIESGHTDVEDPLVRESVAGYLEPMREADVSALLLGCTHFGYLSAAIKNFLGENVQLVSASECAAEQLKEYLCSHSMMGSGGQLKFLTSGSVCKFAELSELLLGENISDRVIHIEVMEGKEKV